ncbi:hypothetical protein BKA61DRAFT_574796 [Leptodontidium sp. MPI-SDFR-AT-0119]|nr:hypothetical protein BKA61DRAFT_574796 [Leptodontidium sp. MPI-SDFR-AT-0119]
MSKSSTKSRTGCEQCKRRNFSWDSWQVERPWISNARSLTPSSALENDILRYWYDEACLNMALFRPPLNPLSHSLSVWLRHSKALRHTLECVAVAHRVHFAPDQLAQALYARGLAISSLKHEVARIQVSPAKQQTLIKTTILFSLILAVSAGWVDPSGTDFELSRLATDRSFHIYIFRLFLYWDAFSSSLSTSDAQAYPVNTISDTIARPPFSSLVHPITGIATTLCPLIGEAGRYLRWVVDTRTLSAPVSLDLESRLRQWQPPDTSSSQPQLLQLAEGYRNAGLIMLYQAEAVARALSTEEEADLLSRVLYIINILKHIPDQDPMLNWAGPLLVISGSELPLTHSKERLVVERTALRLTSWTRVRVYRRGFELMQHVWRLRDSGAKTAWLMLMIESGLALAMG